jgi:hypothetical protein
LRWGEEEQVMRILCGIILGAALTVGGAYLYDAHHAMTAANSPASAQRPLVNWDVVAVKWGDLTEHARHLSESARQEWQRIAHAS